MVLSVDPDGTSPYTYTDLGAIVAGINGPDAKGDDVDCSILADTFKVFKRAGVDPGNITFTICYDADDTGSTQVLNDLLDSVSYIPAYWKITFPDTGTGTKTENFSGFVTGLSRETQKDAMIIANITIKITGNPGLT